MNVVKLEIDTAENLRFSNVPRNCDRVKQICQSIETKPYNQRFVGFIDREFNDFEYVSDFEDKLKGHKVEGRLVWSRGHSIENYFFEYSILREYFRSIVLGDVSEVLEVFSRQLLESLLKIACAISLASKRIGKIQLIEKRIRQDFFEIINNEIVIKLEDLKENLIQSRSDFTLAEVENFCEEYTNFQARVRTLLDSEIVRWLCHGHIGIKLIWIGYDLCINLVDPTKKSSKINEELKKNGVSNIWAVKSLDGECEYPQDVFQLFGIDI